MSASAFSYQASSLVFWSRCVNVHQNRKFKTEGFHITWCDHKLVWEVSVVLNNRPQYTYAYFVPRASGKKQFDFIPKFSLNPKWNLCPFSFLPANPELILWRSWAIMGLFRLMVRACPEFYDVFEKKQFDDHDFSFSQDDYPLTKHAAIASHSKRMLIILHVLPVYSLGSFTWVNRKNGAPSFLIVMARDLDSLIGFLSSIQTGWDKIQWLMSLWGK